MTSSSGGGGVDNLHQDIHIGIATNHYDTQTDYSYIREPFPFVAPKKTVSYDYDSDMDEPEHRNPQYPTARTSGTGFHGYRNR